MDALFSPLRIGDLVTPNRIVMSPMTRNRSVEGVPSDAVAAYYRRRAEGGVGLIITEGVGVDHPAALGGNGPTNQNIPVMYGPEALAGWRRVVAAVHEAHGLIFPQLWHTGVMREAGTGQFPDAPSCRPSGLWGPSGRNCTVSQDYMHRVLPMQHAMTERDIADVIDAFATAARNAVSVGFDGIAIHGAHGYLFDTFFWSETNRRTDSWGGDIRARSRFAAETVKAVRRSIGPTVPIMFRWSQWKQQDYDARLANNPAELEAMLAPLVDAGVNVFDASARRFDDPAFAGSPITLAGWTKRVAGIPTMAVGGVGLMKDLYGTFKAGGSETKDNLQKVRDLLAAGEFDLIGVARALIADHCWPKKVANSEALVPLDARHLASFSDSSCDLI